MSGQELYDMLPENPVEVLAHWREIREKIHDEFDRATTEEQRAALLQLFTTMMNMVEPTVGPAEVDRFREARRKDYNLFIVKESLVGEDVCTETLDAVTRREVTAGRMAPDHELRKLAENSMAAPHFTRAELLAQEEVKHADKTSGKAPESSPDLKAAADGTTAVIRDDEGASAVLEKCIEHGRTMLASQLPQVDSDNYDFMPQFKEMTTQLYLAGTMWRFGERFQLPTGARDRGFICLMSMLVKDGMSSKEAQRRIAHLNQISRTADGRDTVAIAAGHGATEGDGSLARVFEHFRNVPGVSGAPYRLISRAKPIAAILAVAAVAISLLIGSRWGVALGVGAVVGISTIGIALVIYRQMVGASGFSS